MSGPSDQLDALRQRIDSLDELRTTLAAARQRHGDETVARLRPSPLTADDELIAVAATAHAAGIEHVRAAASKRE